MEQIIITKFTELEALLRLYAQENNQIISQEIRDKIYTMADNAKWDKNSLCRLFIKARSVEE